MEEYRELIKQALFDVADLRASIEYDEEFMGDALTFIDQLETSLLQLDRLAHGANYQFRQQNLPFMSIVNNTDETLLPFKHLLLRINDTHTQGLDMD